MLKRPLILKLFALILFIDPLLRATFISIEREFPITTVIQKTFALGVVDFFNFWFLFPLSGILILSVKLYSYIAFIVIQLYSLYFHLNYEPFSWPYLSKNPSITSYVLLTINVTMVLYLLTPRSREIFFDKSLRWWERGSRYSINEPCFIRLIDKEIHGKVCDLSFGGALLSLDEPIATGKRVVVDFEILGRELSLDSEVIRIINTDGKPQFGIKFLFRNFWEKMKLRFLMLSISKLGGYEKYR